MLKTILLALGIGCSLTPSLGAMDLSQGRECPKILRGRMSVLVQDAFSSFPDKPAPHDDSTAFQEYRTACIQEIQQGWNRLMQTLLEHEELIQQFPSQFFCGIFYIHAYEPVDEFWINAFQETKFPTLKLLVRIQLSPWIVKSFHGWGSVTEPNTAAEKHAVSAIYDCFDALRTIPDAMRKYWRVTYNEKRLAFGCSMMQKADHYDSVHALYTELFHKKSTKCLNHAQCVEKAEAPLAARLAFLKKAYAFFFTTRAYQDACQVLQDLVWYTLHRPTTAKAWMRGCIYPYIQMFGDFLKADVETMGTNPSIALLKVWWALLERKGHIPKGLHHIMVHAITTKYLNHIETATKSLKHTMHRVGESIVQSMETYHAIILDMLWTIHTIAIQDTSVFSHKQYRRGKELAVSLHKDYGMHFTRHAFQTHGTFITYDPEDCFTPPSSYFCDDTSFFDGIYGKGAAESVRRELQSRE